MEAVETAPTNQLDMKTTTNGDVQMNVINAVNANGIVSGRKVVDYIWQRIAACAIVIGAGLIGAVIVLVFIMNNINVTNAKQEAAVTEANNKLNDIYNALKVSDQGSALTVIGQDEMLSGSDIKQINELLVKKYGAVTRIDMTDDSINLVKTNGVYKVASLKMKNAAGTARAILYSKLADNKWIMASYNAADEKNPCKNSSDEEKEALTGIIKCPTVVIEDDEDAESSDTKEK
ncbi:MAG: hypothetical protein MJ154_01540 [Candidatus Saccharibacteria bacterium]|nr:hypothetical protein [Candidatus Saccharibacteria bacterium]